MSDRLQFSNSIVCPGCGHGGVALWEENTAPMPAGPQRTLELLSGGFRRDAMIRPPGVDPVIVCENCGSRVAD